jgi:glycosyltransferase involved in cell wall biosynthesis
LTSGSGVVLNVCFVSPSTGIEMRASVIVCTRNRADSIGETMDALRALEFSDREVLIVDSSDGEQKLKMEKLVGDYGAKYVHEPRRGLSIARNTGIAAAKGEFIAFTDDDCIPAPNWLTKKVENLSKPDVWCCTGRVIQHNTGGASNLFEEVAGQDLGPERRVFTKQDLEFGLGILLANVGKVFAKHMKNRAPAPWSIGHGSSTSFRREAFQKLGGFDARFGGGAPLKACDDTEMFYRILKAGHSIVYEPEAVVRHKHRLTSDFQSSGEVRRQSEATADEVFKTRYVYSFGGAAFMREHRQDALMRFQFYGRLIQLIIKTAQYKILGKRDLAESFSSDLRGFRAGWALWRKMKREGVQPQR